MEHHITIEEFSDDLIEEDLYQDEDLCMLKDEYAEQFLQILQNRGVKPVRGDTVMIDHFAGYRNEGRLIFDGEKIIGLDTEPDDYGTVPKQFHILEAPNWFTPQHFSKIDHNRIVWFNYTAELKEKLIENIRYESLKNSVTGEIKFFCYSTVLIPFESSTKNLTVIYDYLDSLPHNREYPLYNEETWEINSEKWCNMLIESFRKKLQEDNFEFNWNEDDTLEYFFPDNFILKYQVPELLKCPICQQESNGGGSSKEGSYYCCSENHRFTLDSNFEVVLIK